MSKKTDRETKVPCFYDEMGRNLDANDNSDTGYNVYLRKLPGDRIEILMPSKDGTFQDEPLPMGSDNFRIKWPVNPHYSGVEQIAIRLNESFEFRDTLFVWKGGESEYWTRRLAGDFGGLPRQYGGARGSCQWN